MSRFAALAPFTDLAEFTGAYPLACHVVILVDVESIPLDLGCATPRYLGSTVMAETVVEVADHLLASGWTEHPMDDRSTAARMFQRDDVAITVELARDALTAGRA